MADKQVIVEIKYDTDAAIKSLNELTSTVEGEKIAQAKLKQEMEAGTISQKEYSIEVEKSKQRAAEANGERKTTIKLLASEKGSINELKAQIADLTKKRDRMNMSTVDGKAKAHAYNKKIDEMKKALKGAQTETGKTTGALGMFANNLSSLPGPLGGVVNGIGGMTKASLKFIATPIGAIIAAIVLIVTQLIAAFKRSEDRMNKVKVLAAGVSGVFKAMQKALEPVVDFLVNNLVKAFEAVGNAVDWAMKMVDKGLRAVGWNKAADAVKNWTEKIKEGSRAAMDLATAEAELQKMQRNAQKIQKEYELQAERLRQLRDDDAKSIDERIKANERLGLVLKQQLNEELKIANQALRVANLRIQVDGETTANLDERAEALTRIADIQERISGKESEQLKNINSLLKERAQLEADRLKQTEENEKAFLDFIESQEDGLGLADKQKEAAELQKELSNQVTETELENANLRREALEQERELHAQMLEEQLISLTQIIDAAAGMADARVTIASDAAARLSTINWAEVKDAKDAFVAIASAAQGLTSMITAGHEKELNSFYAQRDAMLAKYEDNEGMQDKLRKQYAKKEQELKKKQFQNEKKKALLDASIATAVAIVKGLQSGLPLPGLVMAALAGVIGGFQIASIAKQQYTPTATFAEGGAVIGGKPHSEGGTQFWGSDGTRFEAERGEALFVMKKDATAEIAALSMINESHGGRSWTGRPSKHLQEGGSVDVGSVGVEKIVDEAIARTPIFVKVGDVETGLTEFRNVKQAGVI